VEPGRLVLHTMPDAGRLPRLSSQAEPSQAGWCLVCQDTASIISYGLVVLIGYVS
jgi:hypothetical protein